MTHPTHRRRFLAQVAGLGAGLTVLRSSRTAFGYPTNERLNLGLVGLAGYGVYHGFVSGVHLLDNVGFVALCDVDQRKVQRALAVWDERARQWPDSTQANERAVAAQYVRLAERRPPLFEDFRRMLDEKDREIDAVAVATPDHTHAVIAAAALQAGKHVFAEKPLTISAHEARALRALSARTGLATTVNTGGAAQPRFRRGVEVLREGMIGPVEQVHLFFSRGGRNFQQTPQGSHEVPPELNWDLWLAQVAWREYHPDWINRIAWRGTSLGELGNFGPHTCNMAFIALNVKDLWDRSAAESAAAPIRVQAECSELNRVSYPRWERIRWELPARGDLPPVAFTWRHGYLPEYGPDSRDALADVLREHGATQGDVEALLPDAGALIVGRNGLLATSSHNTAFTLLPRERFAGVEQAGPQTLPHSPGHYREWTLACRGGPMPLTSFADAAPHAEMLTLGEISTRFPGESLLYDPVAGRIVNHAEADAALSYPYREGWNL